jgi:hypothetical protein
VQEQPAALPEPVVPSPVQLPPELHTAVEKTLQDLKQPTKPYPAAAPTVASWQQQEPNETARYESCSKHMYLVVEMSQRYLA